METVFEESNKLRIPVVKLSDNYETVLRQVEDWTAYVVTKWDEDCNVVAIFLSHTNSWDGECEELQSLKSLDWCYKKSHAIRRGIEAFDDYCRKLEAKVLSESVIDLDDTRSDAEIIAFYKSIVEAKTDQQPALNIDWTEWQARHG